MSARISWISSSPIKGLRLHHHDQVELTTAGVPGDRAYFIVDGDQRMISATRLGPLLGVTAKLSTSQDELKLVFPDGEVVAGKLELGDPEPVYLRRIELQARPVLGEFSAALSDEVGQPVRLVKAPPARSGIDRGAVGAVTLLSVASLERLRVEAGVAEPVDPRRFRMNFGIEGLEPHAEDGWVEREVELGEAVLEVVGHVGRCAVTTRDPDSGEVDFETLDYLAQYRKEVEATEPLPFGVYAKVVRAGRVRLGDAVVPSRGE